MSSFFEWKAGSKGGEFGEEAFDAKRIWHAGRKSFSEEFHGQPEQRSAAGIFARMFEISGAFPKELAPAGAKFDVEEAQAAGCDFVLMRYAAGAKYKGHRGELFHLAAVTFAIKAAEEQTEERHIMRVHGQFARGRMAEIAEDGGGEFDAVRNGAEELAAMKALFAGGNGLRLSHAVMATELQPGRMLLLF